MPRPLGGIVALPVLLNSGAVWRELDFSIYSGKLSERKRADKQGGLVEVKLSLKRAKDSPSRSADLINLENEELIVLHTDHNGTVKILGNLDQGVKLNINSDTGSKVSDYNGMSITLQGQQPRRAPFYTYVAPLGGQQFDFQNGNPFHFQDGTGFNFN